jgi:hypothetical protein
MLELVKERAEVRIGHLRAALDPFDFGPLTLPFETDSANNNGNALRLAGDAAGQAEPSNNLNRVISVSPFASTGMRQAIRQALKKRGRARAPEIAQDIQAMGVPTDGKTSQAGEIGTEGKEFVWKD